MHSGRSGKVFCIKKFSTPNCTTCLQHSLPVFVECEQLETPIFRLHGLHIKKCSQSII